jgi:AcrR family transcriptional regulator
MVARNRHDAHTQDTRRALLAVGTRLFSARGYAATSIEEVADRAGMTTGALYHHFQSKRGLFEAVLEAVVSKTVQGVSDAVLEADAGEAMTPEAQIRAGILIYLDACMKPEFSQIVLIDGPSVLGHQTWDRLVAHRDSVLVRAWLDASAGPTVRNTLSSEALAYLFGAMISQASLYIVRAAEPVLARTEVAAIIDWMLSRLTEGSLAGGRDATVRTGARTSKHA